MLRMRTASLAPSRASRWPADSDAHLGALNALERVASLMSLTRSVAVDKRTDLQPPNLPSEFSHGLREPVSYVPCSVCQREIPLSAAAWRESSDYVAYFCGFECYDRWRNQSGGL